jgi:histidine triad (HIT) family protein
MTMRGSRANPRVADCPFCRIVAGQAPASTIFETPRTLAFMDLNPVRCGHVLVIPKAHRAQIWEMRDEEFAAVYRSLPSLVRAVAAATKADAVDILSLNGPAGGQTVFHLHVHLIPVHASHSPLRRRGHRVALELEQRPATRAALDRIARRIRGCLT